MAISKVVLNGTTLMDVTQNTVTADDMKSGTTATAKNGQQVTGNMTTPTGTKQISITENGTTTVDVAAYANAEIMVDVQGGVGGNDYLAAILQNNLTEYSSDIASFKSTRPFYNASALKRVHFPNCAGELTQYLFQFSGIEKIAADDMPKISKIGALSFNNCKSLVVAVFPSVGTVDSNVFGYDTALTAVDLGNSTISGNYLSASNFQGCTALTVLVLRHKTAINLQNVNAFNNTPFASAGTGGTLYVPQATITEYTQATNWSTILGYANNQILPIEGSIYETQYADGTAIE